VNGLKSAVFNENGSRMHDLRHIDLIRLVIDLRSLIIVYSR
jgi:hypothetical protein